MSKFYLQDVFEKKGLLKVKSSALLALSEMSVVERALHYFWLMGPLIFLIERSPADIWITFFGLAFIFKTIRSRDFSFIKAFWVKMGLCFWIVLLVSSVLSSQKLYSLGEAFVWIRFPLFAVATVFWLGKDKRLFNAMMVMTGIGLLIMCGILLAEIFVTDHFGRRLTWPYGDNVPGSYISKVGLPAFTIMIAIAVSSKAPNTWAAGTFALFTMVISVMTGERVNFLIRACGGMLAGLLWKPSWKKYGFLLLVEVLAVVVVFVTVPQLEKRYVKHLINELPTNSESAYVQIMKPGILAFESAPLFGIGTGNFRQLCPEIVLDKPKLRCSTHPHNFYVQLLGETGLFGFLFGVTFFLSIIFTVFCQGYSKRHDVAAATAFVIPLALFWPIASTADLFGQWNNCFMWSAIALSLAAGRTLDSEP